MQRKRHKKSSQGRFVGFKRDHDLSADVGGLIFFFLVLLLFLVFFASNSRTISFTMEEPDLMKRAKDFGNLNDAHAFQIVRVPR